MSGPDQPGELEVRILHEIPGRVRLGLSHAPTDSERMGASVSGHEGIQQLRYSHHTGAYLVRYDPAKVSSREIIVRVAFALSLDKNREEVRIVPERIPRELSVSALVSLALILTAGITRLPGSAGSRGVEYLAGAGTVGAVLEHGYQEVSDRGDLDPEVLSVVYLVRSFYGDKLLAASAFTWLATFGRHLLRQPVAGAKLRRVPMPAADGTGPGHEVVVSPIRETGSWRKMLRVLPKVLRVAISGESPRREGDLLEEIERISLLHGEVIDGIEGSTDGIPVKIR
jgi:hypothetical protein